MLFKNREDAGKQLAAALEKYRGEDIVVFALPRGGVVPAVAIANRLDAPLDLILTKKIGHPANSEYAICAIAEDGDPICNAAEIELLDPAWFGAATDKVRREINRRRSAYMPALAPQPAGGKTVIVVDDGIATGLTMLAAITALKQRTPKKLIVAIPVVPYDTAKKLMALTDELVSLDIDRNYRGSVGAYYQDFPQLEDSEVLTLLKSVKNKGRSAL